MSEEMNKEAEVQEEAVDIPVTDGSEEEAADTAQTAEKDASDGQTPAFPVNLRYPLKHTDSLGSNGVIFLV